MSNDQDNQLSIRDAWGSIEAKLDPRAKVFWPESQGYKDSMNTYYWSSSKQYPEVIHQPATPNDIVLVFNGIIRPSGLGFAVKAGSHIAPFGFNSTLLMLIDLALFRDIEYHDDHEKTVDIGPGLQWTDVYKYFIDNKIPRNVVGATSCQGVGVAGFLLGGGYGNKANQYGLAMDNICAMELVTPNGEIKQIAEDPRAGNLSWALRGGGNNFGIVTKWKLKTYEQPKPIYFHRFTYEQKYFANVEEAVWDFAQKVDHDRKANVETKFEWTINDGYQGDENLGACAVAECYYDGSPPKDFFKKFEDIPHLHELDMKTGDYAKFIGMLPTRRQTYRWGVILYKEDLPEVFRGRYTCVMLSKYTLPLIKKIVEVATKYGKLLPNHSGLQLYPDLWPASSKIFENSPPGAWPHPKDRPNFPLPIKCLWTNQEDDGFWLDKLNEMTAEIRTFAIEQQCTTADAPMYYNLALDGTPVETIYRENYSELKPLRRDVDRNNLMSLTGGFRIVAV